MKRITKKRLFVLAALLLAANGLAIHLLPLYRFDAIVLHHTASRSDNYESIRKYHKKERGWRDAAYHLILSNGSTSVPAGHLEATGRYRYLAYSLATGNARCNMLGLNICIVGNYQTRPVPANLRAALGHALLRLRDKYNIEEDRILFHSDCSSTACPGKYITKDRIRKWMGNEAKKCSADVRAQQKQVIDMTSFSIHSLPKPMLTWLFFVSVLISAAWYLALPGRDTTSRS